MFKSGICLQMEHHLAPMAVFICQIGLHFDFKLVQELVCKHANGEIRMDVVHHVATHAVELNHFFDDNLVAIAVALLFQNALHKHTVIDRNRIAQAFPDVLLEEHFDFTLEILDSTRANRIVSMERMRITTPPTTTVSPT